MISERTEVASEWQKEGRRSSRTTVSREPHEEFGAISYDSQTHLRRDRRQREHAKWQGLLLRLKAQLDFGIDLTAQAPNRTAEHRYVDAPVAAHGLALSK